MSWRSAAVLTLDDEGRYLDADEAALDLLGVESVEELRATPPDAFQVSQPSPEEEAAFRAAFVEASVQGIIGEVPLRRLDGELVRVRTAILRAPEGGYRALLYPVERPTADLSPRVYRISDVLAEWRSAERRLVGVDPESEVGRQLAADIELLRQQYQVLFSRRFEGG